MAAGSDRLIASMQLPEHTIQNTRGQVLAHWFYAMETMCMHCGNQITAADGAFVCAMQPYFGLLHRHCAPFFSWNGEWAHNQPVAFYFEKGRSYGVGPPQNLQSM